MLFPIMIFLMVLSPLFIPIAVTVVHEFGNWRNRRVGRPVGSLRQFAQLSAWCQPPRSPAFASERDATRLHVRCVSGPDSRAHRRIQLAGLSSRA